MLEDPCFKVSPQAIARGIEDLLDENERLNNIIKELEKYLNKEISYWEDDIGMQNEAIGILNKLKELKEK